MIGTGMRGLVLLKELVRRDDVGGRCATSSRSCSAVPQDGGQGRQAGQTYGQDRDTNAWKRLLEQKGIDGVIIATPWEYHAPMAIAAMQAGVAVGCEVVAGITLQDHWDVLKTQLSTAPVHAAGERLLPPRRDGRAADGAPGPVRRAGAPAGRLPARPARREVQFRRPNQPYDSGVEFGPKGWSETLAHRAFGGRNGELYPSHGIGPCAMYTGINRGNRFTHINAFATKARGLHEYTVAKSGGTSTPAPR
jgi:hypothetical protein